jgi:hypothetical protein
MNRAEAQRDARRQKVAVLYLSGKVQSEIAQSLKVSQQVVSYDLKQCREEWQTSMLVAMGDIKARELAKIDLMEAEAWSSWYDSKRPKETTTTEAVEGQVPQRKARVVKEASCGDPRYLSIVQSCWERRAKLLGLDAATRVSVDLATLSQDQLVRISQGEPVERVLNTPPTPQALAQA